MKIAKGRTFQAKVTNTPFYAILDEVDSYASAEFGSLLSNGRSRNTRRIVATQAVMKFNSGKRMKFLGSTRWEDTGESTKPSPKKFVPAQVARRERELALDELSAEAQRLGMYN